MDLWTGRGKLGLYDSFGAVPAEPLRWFAFNYAKGQKTRGVVHIEVGLPKLAGSLFTGGSLASFLGGFEFGDVVLGLPIPPLNKATPGLPALALSGRVLLGYQLFHGNYTADVASISGWANTNVTAVPLQIGGGAELLLTQKIGLLFTMDRRLELMRSDTSAKEWWTDGSPRHFSTAGSMSGMALSVHF
jgi:hypothetical protein